MSTTSPDRFLSHIRVVAPHIDSIAILRIDTDWYSSTRHELTHLYPLVALGGIVIIDDYGYWEGARRATDEFLETLPEPRFLHRVDNTVRILVK